MQSAKRCGLRFKNENVEQLEAGFDKAYDETHEEYPCFGAVHDVSAKDWWRRCIIRSFEIAREDAGADPDVPALNADQQERVFQRIYALFGSHATYGVFADVIPFLTWARSCVWKSNFGCPTPSTRCCPRHCVCAMAWRIAELTG